LPTGCDQDAQGRWRELLSPTPMLTDEEPQQQQVVKKRMSWKSKIISF
jgi:hypothetical protein